MKKLKVLALIIILLMTTGVRVFANSFKNENSNKEDSKTIILKKIKYVINNQINNKEMTKLKNDLINSDTKTVELLIDIYNEQKTNNLKHPEIIDIMKKNLQSNNYNLRLFSKNYLNKRKIKSKAFYNPKNKKDKKELEKHLKSLKNKLNNRNIRYKFYNLLLEKTFVLNSFPENKSIIKKIILSSKESNNFKNMLLNIIKSSENEEKYLFLQEVILNSKSNNFIKSKALNLLINDHTNSDNKFNSLIEVFNKTNLSFVENNIIDYFKKNKNKKFERFLSKIIASKKNKVRINKK
jgi:hypothetical protein